MAGYSLAGAQVVCLPCEFVDYCMKDANPTYIAVYIYGFRQCFSNNPKGKVADVAKALGILESDVVRAWQYWEEKGVVSLSYNSESDMTDFSVTFSDLSSFAGKEDNSDTEEKKAVKPSYKLSDVTSAKDKNKFLSEMYTHAEMLMAKPLTQNDILTLYSLYDWLSLPVEVILMIIEHAVSLGKKSMRYIETVALSWSENGITTADAATEYLASYEKAGKMKRRFKKLLGISGRDLTETEAGLLASWSETLGFSDEMIRLAYEKTVMQTGKASFNYMNAILKDWAEKGIKTPGDTEKETKQKKELNTRMPKTKFSGYTQEGSYSDDELEALIKKSSVKVKGE
ncbi:MAG: DnaD domain protein [Clostridia bacterium]|nr:DnaD domain protein [Clostridia bacterium]